MRVLFVTYADDSHYALMVSMAWAMKTAGHEVRVASQVEMCDTITGSGLEAVPVGNSEFHRLLAEAGEEGIPITDPAADLAAIDPEIMTWDYMLGSYTVRVPQYFMIASDPGTVAGLVDYARYWRPDLIIREPFTFAGAIAAHVIGVPHARLVWCPDVLGNARARFRDLLAQQDPDERDDPLAEWLTWEVERFGGTYDEEVATGTFDIDVVPPVFRLAPYDRRPVVFTRYVPYNGRAVLPDWLLRPAEKPRVCLTMGMTANTSGAFPVSYSDVLSAIADLDAEIVATVPRKLQDELPPMPDNVRLTEFVPMNPLMESCAAIVHHGGAGTQYTAIVNGVPQLMLPWQWDTVMRGGRLRATGAGLTRERPEVSAEGLCADLERLLTEPSFAEAAVRLRDETLAMPSPNDVVPAVEKLAVEFRR